MIRQHQRGFTLIELIIFIVILGIGIASILGVFTASVKNSADPLVRKQALSIAESMLEEIMLKEYKDPNGGTNGVSTCLLGPLSNRSLWPDVCSYNGYASTGVKDVQGNNIAALSGYNVAVAVTLLVPLNGQNLQVIKVTVTDTQGIPVSLTARRGP